VHAVGFAKKEELNGEYLNVTREGFHVAMNSSVYSLTAAVKASRHLLNPGGSVITLTYHGSQQVAQNYNVMGVAKANDSGTGFVVNSIYAIGWAVSCEL